MTWSSRRAGDLNNGLQAKAFVPTGGPNPTDLLYDDSFSSKVYAVFGQLAFDVVDNLELALALRYDTRRPLGQQQRDDLQPDRIRPRVAHRRRASHSASNPYINPAYTVNPAYATSGIPDRSKTYEQLQPKLSANWKLTDDFALFASYGYGFRSGGFNSSGSAATIETAYRLGGTTPLCLGDSYAPPACDESSAFNISGVKDDYKKEVSKAAELGFKSYLADRTVSLNAAMYYTEVDDMQFFNFFAGPFGLLRVVTNIDKVTLQGVEIDAHWNVTENFSLFGGYGYTGQQHRRVQGTAVHQGQQVPYAPDYTGNVGGEFDYPMGNSLRLLARLDATFRRRDVVPPGAGRARAEPVHRTSASARATSPSRSGDPYSVHQPAPRRGG